MTNTTIKRRRSSRHDKTGCLTCRYRRKKCIDNTHPICGTCARLNLVCVRQRPRNILPLGPSVTGDSNSHPHASVRSITLRAVSDETTGSSSSLCPILELPSAIPMSGGVSGDGRVNSAQHRLAMRYYVSELASHFTVSTQFNSFLCDFVPMAMESPALWNAILALATRHISLSDPSYAIASIEAQAGAFKSLRAAIDSPTDDIAWNETNAATCLIFATGLISTGDCTGWYVHMQGAKHFIATANYRVTYTDVLHGTQALKMTAEGRWVLRNFAYHDILGCVTLPRRPLLEPSYLDDISNVIDSYIGAGTALLRYLARIECLKAEWSVLMDVVHDKKQREEDLALCNEQWTQIENDLHDWICPVTEDRSLTAMAYAYRSAALILLYRMRLHFTPNTPAPYALMLENKIAFQVASTLHHISQVAIWEPPEAALLFPLFIAGGEALQAEHQEAIRLRLGQNLAKRNFQNIARAIDVLETVWRRRRDPGTGRPDWQAVIEEAEVELVLT